MTTQRRRAALDDDDSDLYDPAYFPRKVVRDGGRVSVPIYLTDGRRPEKTARRSEAVFDARDHQPHSADLSDVAAWAAYDEARSACLRDAYRMPSATSMALEDARQTAEDAYQARRAELQDAWRGHGSELLPAAKDGESPRDAYIRGLQWKNGRDQPNEDDPDAAAEATLRQGEAWKMPGATPGGAYGDARPRQTSDAAAIADRDRAYDEMVAHISNAWRRP